MATPGEQHPNQHETQKNYALELVESTSKASGSMGIVEITRKEIKVRNGTDVIGVIPVEGWVEKKRSWPK